MPEDKPLLPAKDVEELARLLKAFDASTVQLKRSHDRLQERVRELTGELQQKNEELSASLTEVSALKNYLANILESITDGVIAIDPDRRVMAFNQSAAAVVLDIAHDRMGRPLADVMPAACRELGRILVRALEERRGFVNVEVVIEGETPRTLSVSACPIRNEAGDLLGAVETFRDLTAIKQLEARAARQDRLAALGEMAAGVAHEIRNPLGGIELYASNLKRRVPADSKEVRLAQKIIAAAGSLNRIVTDMLTFTRGREPARRPVAIETVCRAALDMAATGLDENAVAVEEHFATRGEKVLLDRDLLSQAFLNVALNAAQAMDAGGRLRVATLFREEDGRRWLEVTWDDDGPGIVEEIRDKLFDPFFTTRDKGTGLGLAIVHKIAQDHGGTVSAFSRPEGGARFLFRFPAPYVAVDNAPLPS